MCSILVIEDEKMVLNVIETALKTFGYDVVIASDGREGVEKFDDGDYDLVITDFLMPRLNGDDVVTHIRKSKRGHTPIIGISGTPWMIEATGVDMVLPKPFFLKELLERVQHLAPAVIH